MDVFKVLFVGELGTGAKTSLIMRIAENTYIPDFLPTIGVDLKTKIIKTNFGEIKLQLWDTAGQERFRGINKQYYKGAHCFVLGYDITDRDSFDLIKNWYKDIKNIVGDYPIIYLVGNKIDFIESRQISEEEGISLANDLNIKYFGVSAKTGEGVDILLNDIVNSLIQKFLPNKIDNKKSDKKIENNKKNKEEKIKSFKIKLNENKIDDDKKKFKKILNKYFDF